jgi:signal transduction histidine kinase
VRSVGAAHQPILTLARAEAGEIKIAQEPVDLSALGVSVVDQIEPVAAASAIVMTCDAADGLIVTGDAGWLERLFLILLDNAIKFTPQGGRITLRMSAAPQSVRASVSDTGAGISAGALPHVFERFHRADPGRSRQTEGAGLGLALAKWIVECHRATIDVHSQRGEGSTFTVAFPSVSLSDGTRDPFSLSDRQPF